MKARLSKFQNTPSAAILMHLLLPGLGHFFWREYLFGLFISLIMLMAAALFVLALFIELPLYARLIIYGLPILFYLVSFGDLVRIVRRTGNRRPPSPLRSRICFGLAILYQLLWPLAPLNFAWQNAPSVFVLDATSLAPVYQKGDLMIASRLAYMVRTYFVEKPIFHSLPERFDIVRFRDGQFTRCGVVVGLPGDNVELIDGVVTVNSVPQFPPSQVNPLLNGDWPPTAAGEYSLLVAYAELGRVTQIYDVPITELIGRVKRIL